MSFLKSYNISWSKLQRKRTLIEYKSIVRAGILKLEMSLRGEIKDSKLDVYKAIFITGVVQLLAILGGVLAIVKFVQP